MAFLLTKADQSALEDVNIIVAGDGDDDSDAKDPITLNSDTLMFPPIVTKDSKSAQWKELPSGGFEPFKYYTQSQSRQLGLEFQWVTGGHSTSDPIKLHETLSRIKAYFYGAYYGGSKNRYPVVKIVKLYGLIDDTSKNGKNAAFRMINVDINYSKEMTKVNEIWYPLHVKLSMNLESASQIKGSESEKAPYESFINLPSRPKVTWY